MKCSPYLRGFLGALLVVVLSVDGGSGQTGNCPYQYCSHSSTLMCPLGYLLGLRCVVYNAANIIQVKWYHGQNGNPTELDTTLGSRYTVSNTSVPPSSRFENCTGDDWQLFQLDFNYSETDNGSYWCQIVTVDNVYLELSEPWMVDSYTNSGSVTECGNVDDTDSKCVAPDTATPTLSLTAVLAQYYYSTSTLDTQATTTAHSPVEIPSVPSSSTALLSTIPSSTAPPSAAAGCTVEGTPCFVYGLAIGVGSLTMIVAFLVVIFVILMVYNKFRKPKTKPKAAPYEPQATYYEGEYCLPEVHNGGEENKTGEYQALDLDSTDYTSMYSKIHKQQTPTVERGDHVYAIIDSTRVEPPSQHAELNDAVNS